VSAHDTRLAYLRTELENCQTLRRILSREVEDSAERVRLLTQLGAAPGPCEVQASALRAELFEDIDGTEAKWRQMIAEHLAATAEEVVSPIRAASDDAALFELLSQVGGRLPNGGVR
jgi:hypothetical protein